MNPINIYPSVSIIAGRYEVADRPLLGGMGIVYLCMDHVEDRPVALKAFRPEYLPDRGARDRFLREATTHHLGGFWQTSPHRALLRRRAYRRWPRSLPGAGTGRPRKTSAGRFPAHLADAGPAAVGGAGIAIRPVDCTRHETRH